MPRPDKKPLLPQIPAIIVVGVGLLRAGVLARDLRLSRQLRTDAAVDAFTTLGVQWGVSLLIALAVGFGLYYAVIRRRWLAQLAFVGAFVVAFGLLAGVTGQSHSLRAWGGLQQAHAELRDDTVAMLDEPGAAQVGAALAQRGLGLLERTGDSLSAADAPYMRCAAEVGRNLISTIENYQAAFDATEAQGGIRLLKLVQPGVLERQLAAHRALAAQNERVLDTVRDVRSRYQACLEDAGFTTAEAAAAAELFADTASFELLASVPRWQARQLRRRLELLEFMQTSRDRWEVLSDGQTVYWKTPEAASEFHRLRLACQHATVQAENAAAECILSQTASEPAQE